jgi:glycosyltransferase involved in cell wall biosynthesis
MKILLLSSFFLLNSSKFGGVKRIYLLAKELAKYHSIDVVSMDACFEAVPGYSSEFNYFQLMSFRRNRGLFKVIYNSNHFEIYREDIKLLRKNVLHKRYDVTLIAFSLAMNLINILPLENLGKILYLEDDLLVEQFRERYEQSSGFFKIWKFFRFYQFLHSQEKMLKKCCAFVSISQQEAEVVKAYFPSIKTHQIKYGIPLNEYPLLPEYIAPVLGFIGNYKHPPNLVGIRYFLHDIFPIVIKKIPGCKLVIAGKNIPKEIINKYSKELPVSFWEDVKELKDFYQGISIFINPIISGRGLRTKIVESAAYGRPVITTPLGAEGLEDLNLIQYTTVEEFINRLNALSNQNMYSQVVAYNRDVIIKKYGIGEVAKQFIAIIEQL